MYISNKYTLTHAPHTNTRRYIAIILIVHTSPETRLK
jgi:hypothetical protein